MFRYEYEIVISATNARATVPLSANGCRLRMRTKTMFGSSLELLEFDFVQRRGNTLYKERMNLFKKKVKILKKNATKR